MAHRGGAKWREPSAAADPNAGSQMKTHLFAWWAPSCSNRTITGPFRVLCYISFDPIPPVNDVPISMLAAGRPPDDVGQPFRRARCPPAALTPRRETRSDSDYGASYVHDT